MKHHWRVLAGLVFVLWLLLALTVHVQLWAAFDRETYAALRDVLPRSLDLPFSLLSLLGSVEITTAICLTLVVCLVPPPQRLPLIFAFGLVALIELLGKWFVHNPGPPAELSRYVFRFGLPTGSLETPFSFPSGHTARAAFLGIIVADAIWQSRARRTLKTFALGLLTLCLAAMLVSRVYLGDHWLSDVVGGVLLGAGMALGCRRS